MLLIKIINFPVLVNSVNFVFEKGRRLDKDKKDTNDNITVVSSLTHKMYKTRSLITEKTNDKALSMNYYLCLLKSHMSVLLTTS